MLLASCTSTVDPDPVDVVAVDAVEPEVEEDVEPPPPPPTVSVTGKIRNLVGDAPVEGIEVCVDGRDDIDCTLSDADGIYTLDGVPGNEQVILTYMEDGYFPELIMVETRTEDIIFPLTSAHATTAEAELIPAVVNITPDEGMGHVGMAVFTQIGVDVVEQMLDGATVTIEPAGDAVATYLNPAGVPIAERTETSTNARLFFFNVPPGEVIVHVKHPTHQGCEVAGFGWTGPDTTSVRLVVRPGHVTAGSLKCTQ